jgi:tetratricopeptide (TPR) repeat protein
MAGSLPAWLVALTFVSYGAPAARSQQPADLDRRLASIYEAAYNLDQDRAIDEARGLVRDTPDASRAHRALAAALWLDIIFHRGTVTVDHYVGGLGGPARMLPKPAPAVEAEFKQAVARAIDLATRRLDADPDDVEARFDLGSAYGLQASYVASVEGTMTSALMSARRAFDAQEGVMSRDPRQVGAGVIVGTYRYMVAGLALPSRMFAYMVGFGGGKEKGISLLEAASRDPRSHVEAKTALVLIFSREGRHADALRLLRELSVAFPRNRLFVLEQGAAAIRAGRHAEAETVLTRGLQAFERDMRPKIPGERGLWLYKRGLARFGRDRRAEAVLDLQAALRSAPPEWVRGRALLALGKIADLSGQRSTAIASYRSAREVGARARDRAGSAEATRLLSQPYTRPRR